MYCACTTGANFKPGAGKRTPRILFCTTLVLRLYYGSKFQARSGQEDPEGTFLYNACITLVLREQVSSQERARGPRGYFVVLRLYCACTTGANLKPGASKRTPRILCCITLVLRLYYGSKFQARSRQEDPEDTFSYYAGTTGANCKPGAAAGL